VPAAAISPTRSNATDRRVDPPPQMRHRSRFVNAEYQTVPKPTRATTAYPQLRGIFTAQLTQYAVKQETSPVLLPQISKLG
jgi:hypothetical protein